MSETASPPAFVLPLFFNSVVGVSAAEHGHLRMNPAAGFGFAATTQAVPIGLGEFDAVCQHYPIVFTTGPRPAPMALLSLREGINPFVLPDGSWRPDAYVPAYVRAFPFVFIEDTTQGTLYVGMEPNAQAITTTEGIAMFEDGQPSPALNDQIKFCAAFRDSVNVAAAFGLALDQAGLLEEEEATINFTSGGSSRVAGFKVLKANRLDTVDDTTFLDWRHRGWLAGIYAHLHSVPRWSRLIELTPVPAAEG